MPSRRRLIRLKLPKDYTGVITYDFIEERGEVRVITVWADSVKAGFTYDPDTRTITVHPGPRKETNATD